MLRPCGSWPAACPNRATTARSTTPPSSSTRTANWWRGTARHTSTRRPGSRPSSFPVTASRRSRPRRSVWSASSSASTGTSPRWPGRWASAGHASSSDVLYPALALANSQWWIQSNQCGAHGSTTLLGASRIVAPTGHRRGGGDTGLSPAACIHRKLLVQRIDLQLAYQRDGIGTLLEEGSPAFALLRRRRGQVGPPSPMSVMSTAPSRGSGSATGSRDRTRRRCGRARP